MTQGGRQALEQVAKLHFQDNKGNSHHSWCERKAGMIGYSMNRADGTIDCVNKIMREKRIGANGEEL